MATGIVGALVAGTANWDYEMMKSNDTVGIAVNTSVRSLQLTECYDPELVRELVQTALLSGGLGQQNTDAPLCDIIHPGDSVFIKPNWVLHENQGSGGDECMITHPLFVEAVLKEVLKAGPRKITLADAPIQGCDFEKIVTNAWQKSLRLLVAPVPLEIIDLRRTVASGTGLSFTALTNQRPDNKYILFDIGNKSYLESISVPEGRFRVSCYDPDRLMKTHCTGRHQYLVAKELFEADVVINLPKLKTHRKAGLTAALKNLVGINGDKDFLPHHRVGGSDQGGDCYQGYNVLKQLTERCLDESNRRINTPAYKIWKILSGIFGRATSMCSMDRELDGGWHGNDTVWRMVMDLNHIAVFGQVDGSLSVIPARRIYSLTDAIVAGQGNGPLAPEPLQLGAVTFSMSSSSADFSHCALLRFDPQKIPLIRESFTLTHPGLLGKSISPQLVCNGVPILFEDLAKQFGRDCSPASGWVGKIEWQ